MGAKSLKIVFLKTFPGFEALASLRFRSHWVEVGGIYSSVGSSRGWEVRGLWLNVGNRNRWQELQGKPTAWSRKRQIGIAAIS